MRYFKNQKGIILLSITWIVLILSLILFSQLKRTELGFQNNKFDRTDFQLRMLTKNSFNLILQEMCNEVIQGATESDAPSDSWSWDSLEKRINEDLKLEYSDCEISVLIEDEKGKIHPINDGVSRMEILFKEMGFPEIEAKNLADSIETLSNDMDQKIKNYQDKGVTSISFESLDLRYLMGIKELNSLQFYGNDFNFNGILEPAESREKRYLIKGLTSMLSTRGEGKINPNFAPYEILVTIPGISDSIAKEIVQKRKGYDQIPGTEDDFVFKTKEDMKTLSSLSSFLEFEFNKMVPFLRFASDTFMIKICATSKKTDQRFCINACVERNKKAQISVLNWQEKFGI